MKKRAEAMLNFLVRAVFGMIAVYGINYFLRKQGMSGTVGINPFSFLAAGLLGLPGIGLLYGISFYLGV